MKTLDRYIIRQFLTNFVILFAVLSVLYVMVDVMVNFDEFVDAAHVRENALGGFLPGLIYSLLDFYLPQIPLLFVFFSSLILVAAVGFTFTALSRTGELVAMVTSGISMYRVALPVLVVGGLMNLAALPVQEFVVPSLAKKLARGPSQARFDIIETSSEQFVPDGQGSLLSAESFDAGKQELVKLIVMVRDRQGRMVRRLTADRAVWRAAHSSDRRETASGSEGGIGGEIGGGIEGGGWELQNGWSVQRPSEVMNPSRLEDAPPVPVRFYATQLSPEVLLARRAAIYSRLLSLNHLMRMADNPAADRPTIRRVIHGRFSMVIVGLLVLTMSLPFYLLREPKSFMTQTLQAVAVCISGWATGLILTQAGAGLSPVLAAWLPVAILLPLAAWLLSGLKT